VSLPFVSCQCLTFGSTDCLREAIGFFLRQEYDGRKELAIVNDLVDQHLRFDHPDVRIVNADSRYATLSDKRNAAVEYSRGDMIVCWDDDDSHLPGHLTSCARYLEGYDYARPDRCFVWVTDDRIERIAGSFIARQSCDCVGMVQRYLADLPAAAL